MGRKKKSDPPGANQTAMRKAERFYKQNNDFRIDDTAVFLDTIEINHDAFESNLNIYYYDQYPGVFLIRNAIKLDHQEYIVMDCLRQAKSPNVTNLDTHYEMPEEGIWELYLKDPNSSINLRPENKNVIEENDGRKIDPPTSSRPFMSSLTAQAALRKLRWTSLGVQYHWATKEYHFDRSPLLPTFWKNITHAAASAVENYTKYPGSKWDGQGGIINYYSLKDSLTAHQDRSEKNSSAPLISFSFGNSAVFLMGTTCVEDPPMPILLNSGDIIILSGESRLHFHSLPRVIGNTSPLKFEQDDEARKYMSETRINVNIRQVYNSSKEID